MTKPMLKIIDLFSGCGGLSLGFQDEGFDIVLAIDNMATAVEVYKKNFSHECKTQDLSDVNDVISMLKDIEHDMIIGGPPCQDFSSAGPRDPDGKRANLTYSFTDCLLYTSPSPRD